ncbi:MAG: hypothetical protein M9883_04605 [Methylobacteriaceae bacterium]|nr:hypothetical protein [Methylobacteriaceae bacterium]
MTFALEHSRRHAARTPPGRRRRAFAAIGLGALAVRVAGRIAQPEPKLLARLIAGPVVKRELAFTPRDRAADDSIRQFQARQGSGDPAAGFEPPSPP